MFSLRPRSRFSLPPFEPAPLEFLPEGGDPLDELLLDQVVASIGPAARVVPLGKPLLMAGQLPDPIERRLRESEERPLVADAAAELRQALADLRRSIG